MQDLTGMTGAEAVEHTVARAVAAPGARITADSFRALTARLRKAPAPPAAPEPAAPEQAPDPVVLETSAAMAPEPEPVAAPLVECEPAPQPEPEPDPPELQAANGVDAIVLGHFEPLGHMEVPEPEPLPQESQPDEPAMELAAAIPAVDAVEPPPAELSPEPAEDEAGADPGEGKAARTASPLAGKVFDALVRTISDAVYARPTPAERAAFLREVAELVEKGDVDALSSVPVEVIAGGVEAAPILPAAEEKPADPFIAPASPRLRPPPPAETVEADEDTGELALSLLDMMSGGSASSQPQERALAADTLLRLVPRIPVRQLLAISERLAIMENPPSLLVARLIRDSRPEIAAPLLERCMHISDYDLSLAATEGDVQKQRMTARRRIISPTLSDQLIARGEPSVILTLVRNPGASLNHEAYYRLMQLAIHHHALLAPLTTRADLPAPVAFELFWHVPQELRRFIFSRFLTDSETLNKILKITLATQAGGDGSAASAEAKFPSREAVDAVIATCMEGQLETAARDLADIGGIDAETALRILADRDGEPLAVVLKGLGYPRAKFADALERMQSAAITMLRPDRSRDELQGIFDKLSFNKARILLTYWDWFVRKAGPYAPHH